MSLKLSFASIFAGLAETKSSVQPSSKSSQAKWCAPISYLVQFDTEATQSSNHVTNMPVRGQDWLPNEH